jgi:hypothetical protein|tara:strand:- start:17812 stop:18171 length:360 start_codon:yes stop_codon:yes gene_type:complete
MIIVTTTPQQVIKFIPREKDPSAQISVTVTDQDENISYTFDINSSGIDRYYTVITCDFPNNSFGNLILKEGTFYSFTVESAGSVIYKDMLFCTDQSPYEYSINKNEYKEHASTNEYIVI